MASAMYLDDYDIEPYDANDPTNEPPPDHVVYQPIFKNLKTQQNRFIGLLRDTLVASKYQNDTTEGLLEEVRKVSSDDTSEQTMFAICGDMGQGKSSLINSLLSIGLIARSGAGGESCTWVVQRFMKSFANQTSPFAARVYLFSPEEIRKIVAALLQKYFRATDRAASDEEEPETNDIKSENFNEKRSVLDTCQALFGDKEEFADDEAAMEYLSKAKTAAEEAILEELADWAVGLATKFLKGTSGEEGQGQLSPWPLVNVVDFGLKNNLLREGIVLVDTPGLSDSDRTRAANAAHCHRQCSHKITVADVSRAKNDMALRESLFQGYRLRRSAGTLLVLTKGDNIDGSTSVTGGHCQKDGETRLLQEIKVLRDQRKAWNRERKEAAHTDLAFDLDEQLKSSWAELRSKTLEYENLRASMRNDAVSKAVSAYYTEMTNDPRPLSVFVVGNDAYQKHQTGHTIDEKPFMSAKETAIPAFRARIFILPAEGKLNEALHLANVQLPNLLNYFELYCSKTHMARKEEIEAALLEPRKGLRVVRSSVSETLNSAVERHILRPMRVIEPKWVTAASKLCRRKWNSLSTANNLGVVKKDGFKKGRKDEEDVDWNRDLMQIKCVEQTLESKYEALHKDILQNHEDLSTKCRKMIDSTRAKISGDPQFNVMALRPFLDAFKTERPIMAKKLDNALRDLRSDATDIQRDCMIQSATAYLPEAMKPIYAEAIKIKGGKGVVQRRMQFLEKRVASMSGVWMEVHDSVHAASARAISKYTKSIEKAMDETFMTIHRKFTILVEDRVIRDPVQKAEEEQLRRKLQASVKEALKVLDGPLKDAATACTAWGARGKDSLFV